MVARTVGDRSSSFAVNGGQGSSLVPSNKEMTHRGECQLEQQMPCALRGEAGSCHDAECLSSDSSTIVVYQPTWRGEVGT